MAPVFALLEVAQGPAIKALCFATCGKIIATGAVMSERFGLLWLCRQTECPYKRAETEEAVGEIASTGEPLHIRSLEDTPARN